MLTISRKISVLVSYALLVLFVGIGLTEILHHHVADQSSAASINKDLKGPSLQKYQVSCELCKAIASHHHLLFDAPTSFTVAFAFIGAINLYLILAEGKLDSTSFSVVNKGPPSC